MSRRREDNDSPVFLGATSFAPQAHLQMTVVCTKLRSGLADHQFALNQLIESSKSPDLTPAQKAQLQSAIAAAQAAHAQYAQIVASICGPGR